MEHAKKLSYLHQNELEYFPSFRGMESNTSTAGSCGNLLKEALHLLAELLYSVVAMSYCQRSTQRWMTDGWDTSNIHVF